MAPEPRLAREMAPAAVATAQDGGTWRGPSESAWTKRILRGARPPRESPGLSRDPRDGLSQADMDR